MENTVTRLDADQAYPLSVQLTHSVSGHGLRVPSSSKGNGRVVPGTWGPQLACGSATGIGAAPALRQINAP
jgi:hypothetical protein